MAVFLREDIPALFIVKKLSALAELNASELDVLRSISVVTHDCRPGEELQAEGAPIVSPRLILSGWACRSRLLSNGRRQVFAFLLPGDTLGVESGPPFAALNGVSALTRMTFGDAQPLQRALEEEGEFPGLAQAVARSDRLGEAILLNHIMRLGCQTAYERMAHLLLELSSRLNLVGLADDWRFPLPLTQDVLAEALGLSVVHINRTVQQLRRDGMIELAGGRVRLLQPDRLAHIANYRQPRAL